MFIMYLNMEDTKEIFEVFKKRILEKMEKLTMGAHTPDYGFSFQTLGMHILEAGSVACELLNFVDLNRKGVSQEILSKLTFLAILVHDANKFYVRQRTQNVSDSEILEIIRQFGFADWLDEIIYWFRERTNSEVENNRKISDEDVIKWIISVFKDFSQEKSQRELAFIPRAIAKFSDFSKILSDDVYSIAFEIVRKADNIATPPKIFSGDLLLPFGEVELIKKAGNKLSEFLKYIGKDKKNVYAYWTQSIRGKLSQIILKIFEDWLEKKGGSIVFISSIGGVFVSENKFNSDDFDEFRKFLSDDDFHIFKEKLREEIKSEFGVVEDEKEGEKKKVLTSRFFEKSNVGARILPFGYFFLPEEIAGGLIDKFGNISLEDREKKSSDKGKKKDYRQEFMKDVFSVIWWGCDELIGKKERKEKFENYIAKHFFDGDLRLVEKEIEKGNNEKKKGGVPPVDALAEIFFEKYGKGAEFGRFLDNVREKVKKTFEDIYKDKKRDIFHFRFVVQKLLEDIHVFDICNAREISSENLSSPSYSHVNPKHKHIKSKPANPNVLNYCSLCNVEIPDDFESGAKSDTIGTETWVYSFRILPRRRREEDEGYLQGAGTRICPLCLIEYSIRNIGRKNSIFVFCFPSSVFGYSFVPYYATKIESFEELKNVSKKFISEDKSIFSEDKNISSINHFGFNGFEEGILGILTATYFASLMAIWGFRCIITEKTVISVDNLPIFPIHIDVRNMLFSSLLDFIGKTNVFQNTDELEDFLKFISSFVYIYDEFSKVRGAKRKKISEESRFYDVCKKIISNPLGFFSVLEDIIVRFSVQKSDLLKASEILEEFIKENSKEGGKYIMIVEEISKKIEEIYDIAGIRVSPRPSKHELTYLIRMAFDILKKEGELKMSSKVDDNDVKEYIIGKLFSAVKRRMGTTWEGRVIEKCSELVDILWDFYKNPEAVKQENLLVDAVYVKLCKRIDDEMKLRGFEKKAEELLRKGEVNEGDIIAFRLNGEVASKGKEFINVISEAKNRFPNEKFFFVVAGKEILLSSAKKGGYIK